MDLSPNEITEKEFSVALRGYEKHEVDAYLEGLAEEVRALQEQAARPATPVEAPAFEALGKEVTAVLETAKQAAESLRAQAKQDTEQLRKEASEHAARTREEARQKAESERAAAREEAERVRQKARADAQSARESAEAAARGMRESAQSDAAKTRDQADREKRELLDAATKRHSILMAHERELRIRVAAIGKTLGQLQTYMRDEGIAATDEAVERDDGDGGAAPSLVDVWRANRTGNESTQVSRDVPADQPRPVATRAESDLRAEGQEEEELDIPAGETRF
ncbi:MAG: DivIVA domain-containing protein [Actinomycetota bacterium]|nr:DivIVA domain-containing protein [Actinomycetota bacterium]